MKDQAKIPR
jgi:hypothetical protein